MTTWIAVSFACTAVVMGVAAQEPAQNLLRTFSIDKPPEVIERRKKAERPATSLRLPPAHDALRTTIGVGYVQGADWGTEIMAGGGVAGTQVQLHTLITRGREGFVFDQGAVSVFDPDARWRLEAGDIFSHLRGASRGGRLSWQSAGGRWRPALAVYGPSRGSPDRTTVVSYRERIHVGDQTLLDAEVASDRSFVLRNRLVWSRFDLEAFYRSTRRPLVTRDAGLGAGLTLWRGIALNAGLFRSLQREDRTDWRTISVRLPITRYFNLTLERAHASTPQTSQTTSAAMGTLTAGQLRLFHRHQQGDYDFTGAGFAGSLERQHTQSVASYSAGSRLNVILQLATQRADTGQLQHWEEMQTTLRLTPTTTLRAVTAVPDVRDSKRWRGHFRQELPARFALQADYGRLSAFQSIPNELDRSRFKLMLFKTWDVATPKRGAEVSGRVIDDAGRAVAGAGVKLGSYSTETNATGAYIFKYVPAGQHELSVDAQRLPADVAWDGRSERLTLTARSREQRYLFVAPLNTIHGRVFSDRNGNGTFDSGEAVAGAVLHLDDRVTATDQNGAYSFFNVWPATYVIRLNAEKLPDGFVASQVTERRVTLGDDGPVTNVDFQVAKKTRPVIWLEPSR